MATNLTKQQLFQNRLDNIYPNGNNEVSANMTANFLDNFIESIYTYSDNKLGDFEVTQNRVIGIPGESFLDFNDDILDFSSTSAKIRVGNQNRISINPSTSTTGINLDNIVIFGGSKIGVPGESHLNFTDSQLIFESNSKIKTSSLVPVNLDIENINTQIRLQDEDVYFKSNEYYFLNNGDGLNRLHINPNAVVIQNSDLDVMDGNFKIKDFNFERHTNQPILDIGVSNGTPIQVIGFTPKNVPDGAAFKTTDSESTIALGRISTSGTDYEILDIFNNGYSDSDYVGMRHISAGVGVRRPFVFDSVDHNQVGWSNQYKLYMKINPDGNIGIGREPSTFKLDVDGSGLFRNNLTTYSSLGIGEEPSVNLHVTNYSSAAYARIQGESDGDNFSAFELRDNSSTSVWQFRNTSAKDFAFSHNNGTSWSAPFIIKSGGNVGIGVSNPLQKLSVGGKVESSSGFIVDAIEGITTSFKIIDNSGNQHIVDIKGGLIVNWDIV